MIQHMHTIDTQYHIMDKNQLHPLEKVKSIADLGVHFDSNLTFMDHISEKINKAYSVLGIVKRNFIYVLLYYFIKQWCVLMLSLLILFGVLSRVSLYGDS